jgi:prepilin-type N-terminal cleavage/methylation domain-containing protein/prepilin-type processing-associated H-X9-DG protein
MNHAKLPRRAFTLIELLVVIAIIALLMAILLPAIQKVRATADKMRCQNNLHQIGVALHHYHIDNKVFPASGWTKADPFNPAGKYVGWRALILPYIEQDNIHKGYNFSMHWWEAPNVNLASTQVKIFLCPSVSDRLSVTSAVAKPPRPAMTFPAPVAPTDYEACMGVQPSIDPIRYATPGSNRSVMFRNSAIAAGHVYDGTAYTIMVVECSARPLVFRGRTLRLDLTNDQGICWADSEGGFSLDGANFDGSLQGLGPTLTPRAMNATNENEPYSFHPGGANFLYADGHVTFIRETIPLMVFAGLITKKGSEAPNAEEID